MAKGARTAPSLIVAALLCVGLSACSFESERSVSDFHGFRVTDGSDATPVYWGATVGRRVNRISAPWDIRPVNQLEELIGKRFSLVGFSQPFAECAGRDCLFVDFPSTPLSQVREHGSIPFFSWGSERTPTGVNQPGFQLGDVIDGKFDRFIEEFATKARFWGHPFFLRFNWEMNGDWFPWSEQVNANARGEYVQAWRHVYDIFDAAGADNATWVWCPNVGHTEEMRGLYPGDDYVDWTCLDGFNWGERINSGGWLSFGQTFRRSYQELRAIAPDKPTILGEVASSNFGGNKAAWIRNMLSRIPPGVRGFLWFDVNDRGANWQLELSPKPLNAFREAIQSPRFQTNHYGNLQASPIPPPAAE